MFLCLLTSWSHLPSIKRYAWQALVLDIKQIVKGSIDFLIDNSVIDMQIIVIILFPEKS